MVVLYTLSKLFNVKTACVDVLNQENKTLFLSFKTLYFLSFYCSKECRAFIAVRLLQGEGVCDEAQKTSAREATIMFMY